MTISQQRFRELSLGTVNLTRAAGSDGAKPYRSLSREWVPILVAVDRVGVTITRSWGLSSSGTENLHKPAVMHHRYRHCAGRAAVGVRLVRQNPAA